MKWYFASNSESVEFFPLIKGAVESALKNTTLQPHFIYDGKSDELTKWLEERGVKVIYHKSVLADTIEKIYKDNQKIPLGAYLRCDIPIIEQDDEIVLYTDCDVIFLKDINEQNAPKPKYFACSSQFNKKDFFDFNTGVMFMNVRKLKESYEDFIAYIRNNINDMIVFDQTAYQFYYGKYNEALPVKYNHKPYWGINDDAIIVHYHGAKPINFASNETLKFLPYKAYELFIKNEKAYMYYLELFKQYNIINYDDSAIKLLKNRTYPLVKKSKMPFNIRLKSFIRKKFNIIKILFCNKS